MLGKNRSTGQLIYKKYKTRLNTADDIFDVLRKLVGYSIDMCTVSESAIDFYPDPRDINLWVQNSHILEQEPNSDILIESRKFLEDAYYNQRYLVHERGVRVRLSGYGAIVELQLLVLPTFDDYLQFQVFLVDSSGKKATYFINEEAFLTDTDLDDEIKLGSNDSNIFKNVVFLICSVYHDLVTADTIVVEPSTDHEPKSGQPYSDSDSSEHFLYIRRTYVDKAGRQQEVEPRKPILNAITREPHHVTGHLRRLPDGKNMSAKHRIELEEFEKTTGLRVIRYIKPGFTFVRPHISPSIEGYYKLPRFIKARMQRDIRTMIEKAETDKE